MIKSITASAPGKIHLIGEHSSVYGKPAILCAINRRLMVTIGKKRKNKYIEKDKKASLATNAIKTFIEKKYKVKKISVEVSVNSNIPTGRGLGSSAALCAAVSQALFKFYDIDATLDEIFSAAYEGEKIFHGNPSGGDLAVCVYGGVVWFRKETEEIKLVKKIIISNSIFKKTLLVDSGKPTESTKEMVVDVVGKKSIKTFLKDQEELTKKVSTALTNNDSNVLLSSIFTSGKNLEKIGVVGKKAKKIISDLKKIGDVSKVSGAGGIKGGSGMVIVFCKNKAATKKYCKENGLQYLEFNMESEGVRIEK